MAKVKLGWSQLTIPQKIVKANSVSTTMAGHPGTYVTPDPPLADLDQAISNLGAAESEAIKGGTDRTVTRNAVLNILTALMSRLVDYVQLTSAGDPVKIAEAGLETQSDRSPWPLPLKVPDFQAEPGGNPGTIVLTWDAVTHKRSYVVEFWMEGNAAGEGGWEMLVIQGGRKYTATGLTTGTVYRFRAVAQNSTGLGEYSEEADSVAR